MLGSWNIFYLFLTWIREEIFSSIIKICLLSMSINLYILDFINGIMLYVVFMSHFFHLASVTVPHVIGCISTSFFVELKTLSFFYIYNTKYVKYRRKFLAIVRVRFSCIWKSIQLKYAAIFNLTIVTILSLQFRFWRMCSQVAKNGVSWESNSKLVLFLLGNMYMYYKKNKYVCYKNV